MMKSQVWYEAVQVTGRGADGRISEWYAGDKMGTYMAAKTEAIRLAKGYPDTEYQVIEVRLVECGPPKQVSA